MRNVWETKKRKMKISSSVMDNIPKKRMPEANDYNLPETLGCLPKEVKSKVMDGCFAPVRSMISHALNQLGAEGLPTFAGYGVLSGLSQNGLIRAGVCMRADEMTRKWGEFVSAGNVDDNSDKIQQLEAAAEKFKLKEKFHDAAEMCGFFGGCFLFVDVGEADENLATPLVLDPATFKIGSLKALRMVEPYLVSPGYYNSVDPMKSDYFKPDLWYVQGKPVHISRLLKFSENELSSLLKPAYNFFGLSLAQKVLDAVSHYTACREAAARLLQKYSLTIFKTNMNDVLTGGFDNTLRQRVQYFVQNRDNDGCATIDKETEDIVVMTTSLAGVTDLVRQSMEYVAAMFNEPVTKMWGLSPAGFNSGDSDLRNHYDNIAAQQEKMFGAPMERLCKILQINEFGEIDDSISFKFAPLSEDDEAAQAAKNKTKAETDAILLETGAIAPEDVRQRLIDDENSGYNNLEPYTSPEMEIPIEPYKEEQEEVTVV